MATIIDKKLERHIPYDIICTLSYVDYETFPIECPNISKKTMHRILNHIITIGYDMPKIKEMLIDIVNGEENELSIFVKTYKQGSYSSIFNNIIIAALGFFIFIGLFTVYHNMFFDIRI
jgi:hypothetical protein